LHRIYRKGISLFKVSLATIISHGSLVSTVPHYGLDNWALISSKDRIFLLAFASRPALGHTQPPNPRGKVGPGCDADQSPQLVPRSRVGRSYTSSYSKHLHGVWCNNFTFTGQQYIWTLTEKNLKLRKFNTKPNCSLKLNIKRGFYFICSLHRYTY
jgi:hypothetical protein